MTTTYAAPVQEHDDQQAADGQLDAAGDEGPGDADLGSLEQLEEELADLEREVEYADRGDEARRAGPEE